MKIIHHPTSSSSTLLTLPHHHHLNHKDIQIHHNPPIHPNPVSTSQNHHLKYLLCGAVAGTVSRSCTAPLDRLKVLLQTQLTPLKGSPPLSLKTTIQNLNLACSAIYKCGGLRSFWRGNGLNCMKIFPESGIKFYVFEQTKILISKSSISLEHSASSASSSNASSIGIGGRFIAGGLAGLVSQFTIYPIETLKTRVMAATAAATTTTVPSQHQHTSTRYTPPKHRKLTNHHHQQSSTATLPVLSRSMHMEPRLLGVDEKTYSLVLRTARDMLADGGWRVFFRGLGPSLIGIIPYAGIDLALYETLKSQYTQYHNTSTSSTTLPCGWLLMFGTISASVGATVVYPLSLIRTRMQAQGSPGHPHRYTNALECIRKTYAAESVRGFYRGLAPTLIKVIPTASISYLCYENMKLVVGI